MSTSSKDAPPSPPEDILDEIRFLALVDGLVTKAMVHMGKLIDPSTGEAKVDLDQAQAVIDLLGTLEKHTRGNLSEREKKVFELNLTNLRLTFLSEHQSQDAASSAAGAAPKSGTATDDSAKSNGASKPTTGAGSPPAPAAGDSKP